jgi:benzoyl-CoA reductase/2-hydroxyglutaryl-CoA dehydratase subunit BcrC/BadD/HgdB
VRGMAHEMKTDIPGLFDRAYALFALVGTLPDDMSDEELEGLLHVVPADLRSTLAAILHPRHRRAGMVYLKMIATWLDRAYHAKEEGKKLLMGTFNYLPEFIHAFRGAELLTSEVVTTLGVVALAGQGERYWDYAMGLGIPDFLCSANTIALGSVLTGGDFLPSGIVQSAPGACDANSKIHEFVAREYDIPQFFIEKPNYTDRRGIEQYHKNFMASLRQLEDFIGEELDEARLREVLERANRCTELYYELWDLRKLVPCPVPNIFSLFTYSARFTMWGTEEAVRLLSIMVDTAKEILEKGYYLAEERARTVWTYLPYFFDFTGFFTWLEEQGIVYMTDVLMACFPTIIDTTSMESMLRGLAETAFNMPMTRQMGGDSMMIRWLDDIVHCVKDLGANAAVYCGHHSCKQTWSVASAVRSEVQKRAGVPTLLLQGDSWIKRMTPMSVLQEEISSFVDNVLARKPRGSRRRSSGE